MRRRLGLVLFAIVGSALATCSPAATAVFRCGNAYSERPCGDGLAIAADDRRSAEQQADGRRVAAYDRRRAAALEHERLTRERTVSGAARLDRATVSTAPASTPRRPKRLDRHGRPDAGDFTAFDASSRKRKRAD